MTLELIPLCPVAATLRDPIAVGEGPVGLRLIYEGGEPAVSSDRLNGRMLVHAGSVCLSIAGTTATLDVRITFETDDGAIVLAQYTGRADRSQGPGGSP